MKAPNTAAAEAIANADAYLNNVALPNYSDLARKAECLEKENSRLEDRIALIVAEVEVRNVCGNEMIYPANFAAERFAAIAGKKTLSRTDLLNIKALGFAVEEVAVKKLAA